MSSHLISRELNNDDNAAPIWIATILTFIITTLTLAIRLWMKWRKFSYEDGAVHVGSTIAYAQFGAVAASLSPGLGKSWSSIEGETLKGIALNLTAAKFRNIYYRMHMSRLVQSYNVLLGIAVVWTAGSLITLSAGCDPGHILPQSDASTCSYNAARWGFVLFFDGLTEITFVALAMFMLNGLKANVEEKATLMVAFALRLGVIIFAILSYIAVRKAIKVRQMSQQSNTLAYSHVQIWRDAEVCCSMLTAALPFALRFVGISIRSVRRRWRESPSWPVGSSRRARSLSMIEVRPERLRSTSSRGTPPLRMPSLPNDVQIHSEPIKYTVEISARETADHGHNPTGGIRREDRVVVTKQEVG